MDAAQEPHAGGQSRTGRSAGLFLISAGILLIAVFGFDLFGDWRAASGTAHTVAPEVGSSAPNFTLRDLNGDQVTLTSLRGKKVIINFWATWCGPCRYEMPFLQTLYEEHAGELVILAVNFDEPEEAVLAFTEELGMTFDVLLDPGAVVQDVYEIRAYPSTYFLDEEGVIRAVRIGVLTEDLLDQYMADLDL